MAGVRMALQRSPEAEYRYMHQTLSGRMNQDLLEQEAGRIPAYQDYMHCLTHLGEKYGLEC